jgi:AraC-like DNA-binding protein
MSALQIIHNLAVPDRPETGAVRRLGAANATSRIFILNGRARVWSGTAGGGDFSLKWAPRGQVLYHTDGARHRLRGDDVLLMNPDQPYETVFADAAGSESFCVFFSRDLLGQAWAAAGDPERPETPAEFPNLVFEPRPALGRALVRLRRRLAEADAWPPDLEAELLLMLTDAVAAARTHRGQAARLTVVKPATRGRLLSRVEFARRLIVEAGVEDLDALAQASGLSKFHLLRLFRAVQGATPMKYAEGVRLERAAERLRGTGELIEEIAFAAGYESSSAFGRAFRRRFALAPRAYRTAARN